MKWRRTLLLIGVWMTTAASFAGIPGAVSASGPSGRDGRCGRPEVTRRTVGSTAHHTSGVQAAGLGQTIGVTVARGPRMVVRTARGAKVIDARGDGAGWTLTATLTTSGRVCVESVEAIARSTSGLHVNTSVVATPGRPVPLVTAAPGTGPGAYDVRVAVAGARNADGSDLGIRFDITPPDRRVSSAAAG